MEAEGRLLHKIDAAGGGHALGPHVFRVRGIEGMAREIFGPVLHVATFRARDLDRVIAEINARGYGLTFGVHTRIDRRVQQLVDGVAVGNIYVNRNQIGAVVGSQPFGGEGLSGTGPKGGGPHYLSRFRTQPAPAPQMVDAAPVDRKTFAKALKALSDMQCHTPEVASGLLRTALRGRARDAMSAAAALDMGPVDLPGPTGEANYLTLHPRGTVLCLGPGSDLALDQAVQALRAGNRVLVVADDSTRSLQALVQTGLPLIVLQGRLPADLLVDADISAVADLSGNPEVRQTLARRDGPILPLINQRICPQAYVHERAICIDTTAAGGNADLLASA